MQCTCGGELVLREGVSYKYSKKGKPYAFYGCSNFRAGCKITLDPAQVSEMEKAGVEQVAAGVGKKRIWTKQNHSPITPKQLRNTLGPAVLSYRRLTDEQEAAVLALTQPGVHFIRINADAGVGKTTWAKQVAARVARRGLEPTTGIIMAFGRRPSHELLPQLPPHWVASTVHSAGNSSVCAYYGLNPLNSNDFKTRDILISEYGKLDSPEKSAQATVVRNLVSMCKNLALDESITDQELLYWAKYYNKDIGLGPSEACTMVRTVLKVSRSPQGIRDFGHDFGDMIWLPVVNKLPVAKYSIVIVDEAQDSSVARMKLALMSIAHGGSLGIIGDKSQAIFGFTCADTKSLDTFAELIENHYGQVPQDFAMTINWRCPSKIIQLTQIIHPSIKARPGAPEGWIHEIEDEQFFDTVKPGDTVLCRVNADLIRSCYKLIKNNIGAVVLGRDIGLDLKKLIRKLAATKDGYCSTLDLIRRAGDWYDAENALLAEKTVRNLEALQQKLDDDYECIVALCGVEMDEANNLTNIGIPTVEGVLKKIDAMFGDEDEFDPKRVVLLSTVHKFKGGQCARIFLLRAHELHPHPMAESEWEIDQETNILYVAITRTGDGTDNPNQRLFFVGAMPAMLRDKGGAELITTYEGAK